MTRMRPTLYALSLIAAAGCGHEPITAPITALPRPLTLAEARIVATGNRFALRLFREVTAREPPAGNLLVSPLSVGMALGMTMNGAAGTTLDAMRLTFGLDSASMAEVNQGFRGVIDLLRGLDPRVDFTLANSIWYRQGFTFEPAFLDTNRRYFDAEVRGLDFAAPSAPEAIDAWVREATRGRIRAIAPRPIPDEAIMYLIDAVYFKSAWTERFEAALTRDAPFRRPDGSTVTVRMMAHAGEVGARVAFDSGMEIVDLPYGGGAYSMTIVMPDDPAGLDALVDSLNGDRWSGWMDALDSTRLVVSMPRFTVASDLGLNDALAALGMPTAFCGPWVTDFSRMIAGVAACISNVRHKTWVEVNEEGTEAAAATSVEMGVTSVSQAIVVDRPFVFVIRERFSGTILFIGKVVDPAAS